MRVNEVPVAQLIFVNWAVASFSLLLPLLPLQLALDVFLVRTGTSLRALLGGLLYFGGACGIHGLFPLYTILKRPVTERKRGNLY